MAIKFNHNELNAVIKHFCIITNVSVDVLDADFVRIASYSEKKPEFCKEIQKRKQGKEKCFCSDSELLQKCKKSRRFESHICHAGILDAAMPIIKDDKIMGYAVIGRTRVNKFDKTKISWFGSDTGELERMYYDITEYNDRQIQSMFELAAMIVSFILTNDIISAEVDELAQQADEYIEQNLCGKISIGELCARLNVSRNLLYKSVKEAFGATVNEHIMSKRMQKGRELLKNTDYSMSRIADEIGIGSYTYFSKLFKQKYGLTPLAFRKINAGNGENSENARFSG